MFIDGEEDQTTIRWIVFPTNGAKSNMARTHGRCPKGERLRMGFPHGHWRTKTFVGPLTLGAMIAPFVLTGAINRAAFET